MKKQIVTAVEPVFLSLLVDRLTGLGHVSSLTMLQHLFANYGAIGEIRLKEDEVKIMGPYNPVEPLDQLIKQVEKGREFARSRDQKISDAMMTSKGITLMAQTGNFNDDIREWRRQSDDLKTWGNIIRFPTKRTESKKERQKPQEKVDTLQ